MGITTTTVITTTKNKNMQKYTTIFSTGIRYTLLAGFFTLIPLFSFGMHIMEGYLSWEWALFWSIFYLPFFIWGYKKLRFHWAEDSDTKMLLAMVVAFAFVLSSLKLPSVSGSSSHATGVGFGTILFGPMVMTVLGLLVLIFQVFLLAHGGITTLGANATSMCLAGPLVTWGVYLLLKRFHINWKWAVFFAVMTGDWATYLITSIQLALAHPDAHSGIWGAFIKFISVFGITQIPIAIVEGIITVMVMNTLSHVKLFQFTNGYPTLMRK